MAVSAVSKEAKMKRIIQIILLVVVVGSISYLVAREMLHQSHNKVGAKEDIAAVTHGHVDANIKPDHVIVYYFYGNFRCAACKKIEAYSKESINDNFSNELKSGLLSFKVINVEEPENRHFIQDYGLYTKSLIVASYAGDQQIKYKNLERVWDYLGSKDEFEDYVKTELSGFLSEVKR